MDDHRRPLSSVSIVALTLAILAVPTPGHTAPTASPVSHDEIRARLWEWKLDDADALLSRAADPTSVETHVLRARLDLLRGRHDAVIERLGPRASGAQASPELRVVLGAALDARGRL